MYRAIARRPDGRVLGERTAETAELAARLVLILAKANGWTGDENEAVASLMVGEPIEHKGFVYEVQESP
ncbi:MULTISPECIES: hypothetical protein [unclassified Kitasatospora]|uniref:hypothetical protein n=1 Tax=unclassified Kitasatospora TaxID=2633591 RepID=UPI0024746714|nr:MULTISPECIES: hypothetical protein [unclassified Kitasatospora]MDH6123850.1 hypothetical protein [Kitasatospora sp. GP82]MDH6576051.1 hypothetical protein [Kitasatospora sp. MAP5-34]